MRRRILTMAMILSMLPACGDGAETTATGQPAVIPTTTLRATTSAPTTTEAPATTVPPPTTIAATTMATTTTAAATTKTAAATTTAGPSAADALAAFFAAAEALDAEIAAAAAVYNASFDETAGTVGSAAIDAISALDARPVAALIPPGLPTNLETAVLAVYADLDSRVAALDGGTRYLNAPPGVEPDLEGTMRCLGLGSASNARFDADLDGARAAASAAPPPTAALDSVAGGILAVRIDTIHLMNWGCDGCGGVQIDDPIPVDWESGTVMDSVEFDAAFSGGEWDVLIYAC